MVRTYVINVRQFDEEDAFRAALPAVSPYRQKKIALLKNEREKRRSLGAAFALNAALKYYGMSEQNMEYVLGEQGKPMFRDCPELSFSLSHSGDYAICSLGERETGCDIERVRPDKMRVAERFYAEEEKAWIYQADVLKEQESRMFRIWTMKESFLKVTGCGMALPLKDFAVLIGKDGINEVRHSLNNKRYRIKEYSLPDFFQETEEYRISVCAEDWAGRHSGGCGVWEGRSFAGCESLEERPLAACETLKGADFSGFEKREFAPELEIVSVGNEPGGPDSWQMP